MKTLKVDNQNKLGDIMFYKKQKMIVIFTSSKTLKLETAKKLKPRSKEEKIEKRAESRIGYTINKIERGGCNKFFFENKRIQLRVICLPLWQRRAAYERL